MTRSLPCLLLLGCQPVLESAPTLIREARVIAVESEPAETEPGTPVTLRALAVSPAGTLSSEMLSWALCSHGRRVAENDSVAAECLQGEAPWIATVADQPASEVVTALIPADACSTFGSEPLPAEPGEPPHRPADPDVTGGYYQPVRTSIEAAPGFSFGHVRLRCDLPGASVDLAREYSERYTDNQNPTLLELAGNDSASAGSSIELQASWTAESAEPFVVYDILDNVLRERVEALRVSWFATAGTFSAPRTEAESGATGVSVVWQAPSQPGVSELWAVLRDDRGGVSWQSLIVDVQ
jgi:hypothetical protein